MGMVVLVVVLVVMLVCGFVLRCVAGDFFFAADRYAQMRPGDAAFLRGFRSKDNARKTEMVEPVEKASLIVKQLQQRCGDHISGCAHRAVKIQCTHLQLHFKDGIALHEMPRELAQAEVSCAKAREQFCRNFLQGGFLRTFIRRCFRFTERIAASAGFFEHRQQCFLCVFQHYQRIKHRCCAHLAAGQEDTAPTGRHHRHWGHCCQLAFRGHFRLHLQLQPEHRFCLFHVLSF